MRIINQGENLELGTVVTLKNGCTVEITDVLDVLDDRLPGIWFWACTFISGNKRYMRPFKQGDWSNKDIESQYYLITLHEL